MKLSCNENVHFTPTHVTKLSPQITVGDLQKTVAFWDHQVYKSTIRCHFHGNKLFERHTRRNDCLSSNHKHKHLVFIRCYRNWNQFHGEMTKSTAFWQQTLKVDLVYQEELIIGKRT